MTESGEEEEEEVSVCVTQVWRDVFGEYEITNLCSSILVSEQNSYINLKAVFELGTILQISSQFYESIAVSSPKQLTSLCTSLCKFHLLFQKAIQTFSMILSNKIRIPFNFKTFSKCGHRFGTIL